MRMLVKLLDLFTLLFHTRLERAVSEFGSVFFSKALISF